MLDIFLALKYAVSLLKSFYLSERESEADSMPSTEPDMGLNPMITRSQLAQKPKLLRLN